MAFRKSTLRRLPPFTRKYARLLGDLDSILRRGKNLVEDLARIERESQTLAHARERGAVVEMPQTEAEPGFEL
jgi:hypothetical protein